jgi:DNA polymerase-3 subunit gamma/tau
MKYEVIARRYRPRKFDEVVGQESVARTLRGGILQERMAHAYLFAGPRGVGKTSMARIFSKAINCPVANDRDRPEKEWANPCDQCGVCEAIHSGRDIDVIELDGASHRGIDDIRAIIEGVNRPASRGDYKVYLIDEVHMLTREAFNALLKTLEEPPAHVKFVFATTEPHKIPDTVLSRCQRFDFQPIREEDTVKRLAQICKSEKRKAGKELLGKIARYSRGGMRDSQTLLDQLMTYCEGELTEDGLDKLTGRVSTAALDELLAALVGRDASTVLTSVRACFQAGADPSVLVEQVIERLHEELVGSIQEEAGDAGEGEVDRMIGCLQILLGTATQLRSSAYPDIAVEVSLVKLARLEDPRALDKALGQLKEMEQRIGQVPGDLKPAAGGSAPSAAPQAPASPAPSRKPSGGGGPQASHQAEPDARQSDARQQAEPQGAAPVAVAEPPRAEPAEATAEPDFRKLSDLWNELISGLGKRNNLLLAFLDGASLAGSERPDEFCIFVQNPLGFNQLQQPEYIKEIQQVAFELTGDSWQIRICRSDEAPLDSAAGGEGKVEGEAPASGGSSGGRADENSEVSKTLEIFNGRKVP